jgi:hypothetical protein
VKAVQNRKSVGPLLTPTRQQMMKKEWEKMISRIWHGWTKPENADIYENLLKTEIFPGIASKNVSGYRGIQLFRRPLDS